MAQTPPHLEADLILLPTEQSGRRAPIYTGFRFHFHCDGRDWDATHTLTFQEFAFPGERATVGITFRSPEAQYGKLHPGKRFEVREAGRVIGRGEILRIVGLPQPPSMTAV